MDAMLLKAAHEKIPSVPVLVNLISKRERELINGAKPLIRPEEPELSLQYRPIGAGKRDLAVPHRLHLCAGKNYTALDRLEYGIVVPGLPVFREDRVELLVLLPLHLHLRPSPSLYAVNRHKAS